MTDSFRIRSHEDRDIDAFLNLYGESFPEKHITPKTWRRISGEPASVWLTEHTGTDGVVSLAGFLYFWTVADEFQIIDVGVLPHFRRCGLASKLLNRLLEQARTEAKRVVLEVRVSNVIAIHLYESLGFTRVGLRERYYGNGEDAALYEWPKTGKK